MGTPAIVGIRLGARWEGTYVGYDGGPEHLGVKVLDLVRARGGDLLAAWSTIAAPPDGWRHAFSEPYEPGFNREYFATGRTDPPLLSSDDAFVRQNAVFWFILDPEARALELHTWREGDDDWYEVGRFLFSPEGHAEWHGPNDPDWGRHSPAELLPERTTVDAWVADMDARYEDAPPVEQATFDDLREKLATLLPIAGPRTELCIIADKSPFLTREGLVCPFFMAVRRARDPSQLTDLIEHPDFLLFPRRALANGARCQAALRAALERLSLEIGLAKVPPLDIPESNAVFSAMFPFHLIAQPLDEAALGAAIKAEIKRAFQFVG